MREHVIESNQKVEKSKTKVKRERRDYERREGGQAELETPTTEEDEGGWLDLLGGGRELGDRLGSLGDSVLGELSGEDEPERRGKRRGKRERSASTRREIERE